jgi:general secretion pathway protein E
MEGSAQPRKLLHLEALTEWLAGKVGLPYLHIDPFKIDFASVTKVMSNAYASVTTSCRSA